MNQHRVRQTAFKRMAFLRFEAPERDRYPPVHAGDLQLTEDEPGRLVMGGYRRIAAELTASYRHLRRLEIRKR